MAAGGEDEFDVVVIGAGPAGEVAAGRLSEQGLEVAMIENDLVGGECSFYACMPSKALLRPAQALAEVRRVPGAAEAVTRRNGGQAGDIDVEASLRRRDEVVHDLDDSAQLPWVEDRHITLVRGHGRLVDERKVHVEGPGVTLTARRAVIIATGSGAAMPPIPGLAEAKPWTNREGTTSKTVPASLVILGGGVVGCELAQAWATLGARVAVLEALPRLLSREEPFVGEQVADALRGLGVDVRVGVKATAVQRDPEGGPVAVELENGDTVTGDELLVAVGRRPLSDDVGLETVTMMPIAGPIATDERLAVPNFEDWLYAIGDVNGRSLLTHMGKYQAYIVSENILGRDAALRSDGIEAPRVAFTEPQVAAVGLTLDEAQRRGLRVTAVDHPSSGTAGASFIGRNEPGTSRFVIDDDRQVIVGATFTGVGVDPWLHAATIAVVAEVPLSTLRHAIPCFPTRSEVWLRLQEKYEALERERVGA